MRTLTTALRERAAKLGSQASRLREKARYMDRGSRTILQRARELDDEAASLIRDADARAALAGPGRRPKGGAA